MHNRSHKDGFRSRMQQNILMVLTTNSNCRASLLSGPTFHLEVYPPSTISAEPVTKLLLPPARYKTSSAISLALPMRCIGTAEATPSCIAAMNIRGVFNCLGAQLKAMSTGGNVVSVYSCESILSTIAYLQVNSSQVSAASAFGQFGAPGNAAYCAGKAAVIALTRTAAKENPEVRVNCVSPGKCIVMPKQRQSEHCGRV